MIAAQQSRQFSQFARLKHSDLKKVGHVHAGTCLRSRFPQPIHKMIHQQQGSLMAGDQGKHDSLSALPSHAKSARTDIREVAQFGCSCLDPSNGLFRNAPFFLAIVKDRRYRADRNPSGFRDVPDRDRGLFPGFRLHEVD